MKIKITTAMLLALFAALPVLADAAHMPEVQYDTREYNVFVRLGNQVGAIAQEDFTIPSLHQYIANTRESVWHITDHAILDGEGLNIRRASFQFAVDGANITGCTWTYEKDAGETVKEHAYAAIYCRNATAANPGLHTIELKVTITGNNPVQSRNMHISLRQSENVTIPPSDWTASNRHAVDDIQTDVDNIQTDVDSIQIDINAHNITMGIQHDSILAAIANITGINLTVNNTAVLNRIQVLAEGAETIAVSIDHWFWLAMIVIGFLVTRLRTPTAYGLAGLLAIISLFWALDKFTGMTQIIGLGVSLLLLGHALAEAFIGDKNRTVR